MVRKILPTVGAFVVLTIDPLASLDQETLEDAEAVAACKKMVNKQYVGFVVHRLGLYQQSDPYNACMVSLLFQGEPGTYPDLCIDPSMTVPVLPVTTDSHPSARTPLKPSNPLPWNDCHLSTFWSVIMRSPSAFTEDPIDCIIDKVEMRRHRRFLMADQARQRSFRSAAQMAEESSPLDSEKVHKLSEAQDGTLQATPGSNSVARRSSQTSDGADSEDAGLQDEAVNPFLYNPASKQMITVNFSHDLSTVKEVNDPADFYREMDAIATIQEEAWPRVLESKARAIKAAAEIDAQVYDKRTLDLLVTRPRGPVSRFVSKLKRKGGKFASRLTRWALPRRNSS